MFRTAHPIIDAAAAAQGDLRGFSHRMHMGRTTRSPWDWKAALETGTKLGFAFRFESGLTFVSATLKDHSDSTSAASVGSFFPQTQIFARPEKPLAGGLTQAMRQTSWRLETLANYRHNADCLYFYLTLVRTTAERGPWGKAWQRQDTKDWALWAVNGVSLLTYEFFCKTAPSDSLSMRPGEA